MGDGEMRPKAIAVGLLQPNPSAVERDASAIQVMDAEPSKLDRAANPGPVQLAMSAMSISATRPKEATDHLIDTCQGFIEGNGDQDVSGDGALHMATP